MSTLRRPKPDVEAVKKESADHQKGYRRVRIGAASLAAFVGILLALLANVLEWRPGVAYGVGTAVIIVFVSLIVPAIDRARPQV